jgi:hypothetical protein
VLSSPSVSRLKAGTCILFAMCAASIYWVPLSLHPNNSVYRQGLAATRSANGINTTLFNWLRYRFARLSSLVKTRLKSSRQSRSVYVVPLPPTARAVRLSAIVAWYLSIGFRYRSTRIISPPNLFNHLAIARLYCSLVSRRTPQLYLLGSAIAPPE